MMRPAPLRQAAAKAAKEAEERGAKAAKEMAAKAKKVNDKKPLSFDEMVANSVKQREAELGMTMTDDEIAALSEKLRKAFPSS